MENWPSRFSISFPRSLLPAYFNDRSVLSFAGREDRISIRGIGRGLALLSVAEIDRCRRLGPYDVKIRGVGRQLQFIPRNKIDKQHPPSVRRDRAAGEQAVRHGGNGYARYLFGANERVRTKVRRKTIDLGWPVMRFW